MSTSKFRVGMVMFENITQLDLTGPLEVLSAVPGWHVDLLAASLRPVSSARGFPMQPTATFDDPARYDLFVVPGGPGVDAAMLDKTLIAFIRDRARDARYIFGICTGSLLLGAAGLLQGRRASCHWQATEFLRSFGAIPSEQRMTIDGNIFTSGGVTAGIDMALKVVGELVGTPAAEAVQLLLEYDPEPPFNAGTPRTAPRAVIEHMQAAGAERRAQRAAAVARAAKAAEDFTAT